MRRSTRLSDQPRRVYCDEDPEGAAEDKLSNKKDGNDEEVYDAVVKSESEASLSDSEPIPEESESSLSSESLQIHTSSSRSVSKGGSPKKKSDNKSALKSRLIRKKKKAAIIYDRVAVTNDIQKWAKELQEYQSKVTPKTEVSSLMFLTLFGTVMKPLLEPKTGSSEKLKLEKVLLQKVTLAKSNAEVYSIPGHSIHSLAWIGEDKVCVAAEGRLLILPDGLEANTSAWEDVERISAHPQIHNLVAIVGGDEMVRVAMIEKQITVLQSLPTYVCAPLVSIFLPDPQYVVVGYFDGVLIVWKWASKTAVQIISSSISPVKSLAIDPSGEFVFVGSLDAKVYKVHLRLGRIENVIASLASNPTVSYSTKDGLLYADNENHCRFTEVVDGEWRPRPLGTFDSTVWSIAASSLHNVIASCSANGAIHLSWIASEASHLILEKSIIRQLEVGQFDDIPKLVATPTKETIKLYDPKLGITVCAWSPSAKTPGILAAASQSGHVLLIPCDRHILY